MKTITFKTLSLGDGEHRFLTAEELAKYDASSVFEWDIQHERLTSRDLVNIDIAVNAEPGLVMANGQISQEAYALVRALHIVAAKVKSWNYKAADGADLPVTAENVEALDPAVTMVIARRIENGIIPSPEELAAKNSAGASGTKVSSLTE